MHYTYVLIDPRQGNVFYVGKGSGRRMHYHEGRALKGTHRNKQVQDTIQAIHAAGKQTVAEKWFEHQDEWPCHMAEIWTIELLGRKTLCNQRAGGAGTAGVHLGYGPSDKVRAAMRARMMGNTHTLGWRASPETRAKLTAARMGNKSRLGIPHSSEVKAKLSATGRVKVFSAEHRTNLSAAGMGRIFSPESRAKMSATRQGRTITAETRDKLRVASKGRRHTATSLAKMSAAQRGENNPSFGKPGSRLGVRLSGEAKAKLSAAKRAFHERRRQAQMLKIPAAIAANTL